MFMPDLTKPDAALDTCCGLLPDDATAKPASLSAVYKRERERDRDPLMEAAPVAPVQAAPVEPPVEPPVAPQEEPGAAAAEEGS